MNNTQKYLGGICLTVSGFALGVAIAFFLLPKPQLSSLPPTVVNQLGTGNTSLQGSVKKIDTCKFTTATTTPCSLLNSDGDTRYITNIGYYVDSESPATASYLVGGRAIDVTTSTSAFASSSYNGFFTPGTAFSTSSLPQYFSTSTFSNVIDRVWSNGVYLNLQMSRITSSTGQLFIEYVKRPAQ